MSELSAFNLSPRISDIFGLHIGFFENRLDQAWVRRDLDEVDNNDWWEEAAQCLRFHCGTLGLKPTNENLAEDLHAYYQENKDRTYRAGRPVGG